MTESESSLARTGRILRFLFKYRNAGRLQRARPRRRHVAAPLTPATEGKPEEFVTDLEALGPTFIKIGQALSTRADMVPPEYLVALERMQDNVEPVAFDLIRAVVEEELGVRLDKAFEIFDETPLGSASLAQVHQATMRGGRMVAVKVQRPAGRARTSATTSTRSPPSPASRQSPTSGDACASPTGCTSSARRCWPNSTTRARSRDAAGLDIASRREPRTLRQHFEQYPELLVPTTAVGPDPARGC